MDIFKKQAIRTAISLAGGPEGIKEKFSAIIKSLEDWKDTQPLKEDETDIIGLVYTKAGNPYFAAATIEEKPESLQIKRFLMVKPLENLVTELLEKL